MSCMKSFKSAFLIPFAALFLLAVASPARAVDADSDLVRDLARQVSRSLSRDLPTSRESLPSRQVAPLAATLPAVFSAAPSVAVIAPVLAPAALRAPAAGGSVAFPVLAATYVALNAFDIYTTTKAVSSGQGKEANPILSGVAQTPVALTAAKIVTTATTLVIAKRLWKDHRAASIVLMVAANVGTGFIVGHNATIALR
jgi:hypothetical protein